MTEDRPTRDRLVYALLWADSDAPNNGSGGCWAPSHVKNLAREIRALTLEVAAWKEYAGKLRAQVAAKDAALERARRWANNRGAHEVSEDLARALLPAVEAKPEPCPKMIKTPSSEWQCARPLGHRGECGLKVYPDDGITAPPAPSAVREAEISVIEAAVEFTKEREYQNVQACLEDQERHVKRLEAAVERYRAAGGKP